MGRMKKKDKEIITYELILYYICPITEELVDIQINELDISSYENSCECCGSHGGVDIEVPDKCPSCGKKHNNIDVKSW